MWQSRLELPSDMRVLVAEDEKRVASHIRNALKQRGYAVDVVHQGDEALAVAEVTPYDAIVLDVMMPGRDGLSVLKSLRAQRVTTPVMLLTARGEVSERVEGLELGADDYLSKPFAMEELVARLEALSRRSSGSGMTILKVADLTLNLVSREVARGGKLIELQGKEFALLEYLMRSPGHVRSRAQIIEKVWEYNFDTGTNLVDVYIQRLRRKLDDAFELKLLQTVRGVGYVIRAGE